MQTDQSQPCRIPISTLIAVDLEPTETGVRRINGAMEEFIAEHENGTVTEFPVASVDATSGPVAAADAFGGRLSA